MKNTPEQQNTEVFILNGTELEDLNSPDSPFQGRTLAKYLKDPSGNWIRIMRDGSGKPMLGYLAEEIPSTTAQLWRRRIDMARINGAAGYQDSQGMWYPGLASSSVLEAAAYKKLKEKSLDAFFSSVGVNRIDELADSLTLSAEVRAVEYTKRFEEAIEFQATPGDAKLYPYLHGMTYKGLSMEEAADLVIKNYQVSKLRNQQIADLRMQKNLLLTAISAEEKQEIHSRIIAELQKLR